MWLLPELIINPLAYHRGKKEAVSIFIFAAFPKCFANDAETCQQHPVTVSTPLLQQTIADYEDKAPKAMAVLESGFDDVTSFFRLFIR